jgi:beta-lactamase family protein
VVVLDAYLYPYAGREPHDIASATKSVTSAATGIAIEQGYIKSVDQTVMPLLPLAPDDSDPRRHNVSVRHLLTMTSGFDCDTEGGEKALAAMRHSPDWAAFALAIPMRADPGSRYAYLQLQQPPAFQHHHGNDRQEPARIHAEESIWAPRYHGFGLACRPKRTDARLGRSASVSA